MAWLGLDSSRDSVGLSARIPSRDQASLFQLLVVASSLLNQSNTLSSSWTIVMTVTQ